MQVAPPAIDDAIRPDAAAVKIACRHRQVAPTPAGLADAAVGRAVQLAMVVAPPAIHVAVRRQPAAVETARRYRQVRAGVAGAGDTRIRHAVQLAVAIPAPARHAAVRLQPATVQIARRHRHIRASPTGAADGSVRHAVQLAIPVRAPTIHAAVRVNAATVETACGRSRHPAASFAVGDPCLRAVMPHRGDRQHTQCQQPAKPVCPCCHLHSSCLHPGAGACSGTDNARRAKAGWNGSRRGPREGSNRCWTQRQTHGNAGQVCPSRGSSIRSFTWLGLAKPPVVPSGFGVATRSKLSSSL